ncbi:MAG: hypothetical protein HY505_00200 [Candidatus Yanofskybacteria bacterium]|nr:hypothetical protein [Candidatus Yanofskybacteria bacterium]
MMTNEKHPLPIHNVRIKKLKSLLAIVENSAKGDNYLFRNLYADENGKEVDIFENGHNSCGAHVSWILLALELIKHPHASSWGTLKDLFESGWHEINELTPGAVLVWEARNDAMLLGELKPRSIHIGFYIGDDDAISNDSKDTGFPRRHHYTYNGTRKIDKILWHPELE